MIKFKLHYIHLMIKKSTDPDSIDFRITKLSYKILLNTLMRWENLCLSINFFPFVLRRGEVVHFLKEVMSTSEQHAISLNLPATITRQIAS